MKKCEGTQIIIKVRGLKGVSEKKEKIARCEENGCSRATPKTAEGFPGIRLEAISGQKTA